MQSKINVFVQITFRDHNHPLGSEGQAVKSPSDRRHGTERRQADAGAPAFLSLARRASLQLRTFTPAEYRPETSGLWQVFARKSVAGSESARKKLKCLQFPELWAADEIGKKGTVIRENWSGWGCARSRKHPGVASTLLIQQEPPENGKQRTEEVRNAFAISTLK